MPIQNASAVTDALSYYRNKNNEPIPIPRYILNSIYGIQNSYAIIKMQYNYNKKYTDLSIQKQLCEEYRKQYMPSLKQHDTQILEQLNVIGGTVFHIILFSILPQAFLPNLYIKISDRRKIIENIKITGPLSQMFNMTILTMKKLLDHNLKMKNNGVITAETSYNFEIIKELLFNAIVHRDYTTYYRGDPINIYIYKDHIVITNPGFYHADNSTYLNSKFKYARNGNLKTALELLLCNEIKHHGFRYIKRACKLHNSKEPILYNQEGVFTALIFKVREESIYKEPYTITEIAKYCIEPKTKLEIYNHFFDAAKKDYCYIYSKYIEPLVYNGILEYLYPDHPKSKYQKIKTSEKTLEVLFDI